MTATGVTTIGAWIYPGSTLVGGQSDVPTEITANATSMGHTYDRLHPEYYHVSDGTASTASNTPAAGTLYQLTVANAGVDAYSAANAAFIKSHCATAYVTISGNGAATVALMNSPSLIASFNSTLIAFCNSIGFAGIELDLESGSGPSLFNASHAANYTAYKTMVTTVGTAFHNAGLKLICSLPAVSLTTQSAYALNYADFNTLPIDGLTIQCYDAWGDSNNGWGVGVGFAMQMPTATLTSICQNLANKVTDQTKVIIGITNEGAFAPSGDFNGNNEALTFVTMSGKPGFSTATRDANSGEMYWTNAGLIYNYGDTTTLNTHLATILNSALTTINVDVWFLGGANKWFTGMTFVTGGGGGGGGGGTATTSQSGGVFAAAYASQDTFSGRTVTAGTSLGTASDGTTYVTTNSTKWQASVANNEGVAWYDNSGGGTGYVEAILGNVAQSNVEVTARFQALTLTGTNQFGLFARYTAGTTWYRAKVTCVAGAGNSTLALEMYNGGLNSLKTLAFTIAITTNYRMKFRVNGTVIALKIWPDGLPEPINWTLSKENPTVVGSGGCGIMVTSAGTTAGAGIQFDSYGVLTLPALSKFDYFFDLSNWIVAAAVDGTGIAAPVYANSTAYANGYINLRGGSSGGMDLRADSSGGTANIVYLQTVRNFVLPGTFAWNINPRGPIYAPANYLRSVKALYTAGGDGTTNSKYIETDFELCSENNHPFASGYPTIQSPFAFMVTYNAKDGSTFANPGIPVMLQDIWNDPITVVHSFVVYAQTVSTITYKVDYYIRSILSGPNYTYLGSTLTTHDITVTYTEAFIDLHYLSVSSQLAANPIQLGVNWFYFSPLAGDLP